LVRPIIAYHRVSTARQGRSGLGLEAQREALGRFATAEGFEIVREYTEVETGKGAMSLTGDRSLLLRSRRHGDANARSQSPSWTD
jgi:DNA invertase Pin-like site-specific DNA recombinase